MKAIVNFFTSPSAERQLQRIAWDPEAEQHITKYSGDEHQLRTWFNDGWRIDSTAGYTGQGPTLALTLVLVRS